MSIYENPFSYILIFLLLIIIPPLVILKLKKCPSCKKRGCDCNGIVDGYGGWGHCVMIREYVCRHCGNTFRE